MKKKISKLIATALLLTVTGACVACGSNEVNGSVDTTAAAREQGVGDDKIFIDDQAIALAGEANSNQDLITAATKALDLTNNQRTAAGLSVLTWSQGLADAAYVRATEITTTFSHTRPNGSDWWTVNSSLMYGENLAKLYNSPEDMVSAWMASPSHKANIMDGGYVTCGIAIYKNGENWYSAQEFGY